jgi:phage host-nuclease inhibitor protein Gam
MSPSRGISTGKSPRSPAKGEVIAAAAAAAASTSEKGQKGPAEAAKEKPKQQKEYAKKPKPSKAERRALQEKQRAEKQAKKDEEAGRCRTLTLNLNLVGAWAQSPPPLCSQQHGNAGNVCPCLLQQAGDQWFVRLDFHFNSDPFLLLCVHWVCIDLATLRITAAKGGGLKEKPKKKSTKGGGGQQAVAKSDSRTTDQQPVVEAGVKKVTFFSHLEQVDRSMFSTENIA